MFRLTSVNLPAEKIKRKTAPAFRLWCSDGRGAGPILRVNCYGAWWENPGWELNTVALGKPIATGRYYQVSTPAVIITSIPKWTEVESAVVATPDTFWQFNGIVNFYQCNLEIPSVAIASLVIPAPSPIGNNYAIAVPANFTVTTISSEGLVFTIGTETGSFTQSSTSVTIYGSPAYSLSLGQELLITGNLEFNSFEEISSIAQFYLEDVVYLDKIGWAGHNLSVAKSAFSPQLWEFTWNGNTHTTNLFLKSTSMPSFPSTKEMVISRSSGIINFGR